MNRDRRIGLHHRDGHLGWDPSRPPVAEVAPNDEVELLLADCFDGQLSATSGPEAVGALDPARTNPLTGPIRIAGVAPGQTVAIEILEMAVGEVGWTAILPGFGLLADDFPDPHLVVSTISDDTVGFGDLASLQFHPFVGTVGLSPASPGRHSAIPPRRVGGNLDCRDVGPGATLLLPAEIDGGLLSVGDPHAAQGDGEVCGTAVETTASVRLRITTRPQLQLDAPQIERPARPSSDSRPTHVTTGVGGDLHAGARDATRAMIEHLGRRYGVAPADAYVLCSVAGHLRIAEVVDRPNWVVALELDTSVIAA